MKRRVLDQKKRRLCSQRGILGVKMKLFGEKGILQEERTILRANRRFVWRRGKAGENEEQFGGKGGRVQG